MLVHRIVHLTGNAGPLCFVPRRGGIERLDGRADGDVDEHRFSGAPDLPAVGGRARAERKGQQHEPGHEEPRGGAAEHDVTLAFCEWTDTLAPDAKVEKARGVEKGNPARRLKSALGRPVNPAQSARPKRPDVRAGRSGRLTRPPAPRPTDRHRPPPGRPGPGTLSGGSRRAGIGQDNPIPDFTNTRPVLGFTVRN
jgi:hypothetical protein